MGKRPQTLSCDVDPGPKNSAGSGDHGVARGCGAQSQRGVREIKPSDLRGLRDVRAVSRLFDRLHGVGTRRDRAGQRKLFMDQYCLLVLAWLFNPIVDSLGGLQQMSSLAAVQKRLGVRRASLGSLSESVSIFDPEPLRRIAEELHDRLPDHTPVQFQGLGKTIIAVDGSVFRVLAQIARLAWFSKRDGKAACGYRLHTQFEVFRGAPSRIDVTPSSPRGDGDERRVLERTVESGRCYIIDRGYEKYSLWNAIHRVDSNYVCRLRDQSSYTVVESRELTAEDRQASIISDQIVRFGTPNSRTPPPDHATRLVIVQVAPHDSRRRGSRGVSSDGQMRIVTNLLEVPAELVAALYQLRWTIELYFRMIKQLLGCRHLLSTKAAGVEIQAYLAIIACMLILARTGKQPTKRTYEMICFYLLGWASLEEVEDHLKKLPASRS